MKTQSRRSGTVTLGWVIFAWLIAPSASWAGARAEPSPPPGQLSVQLDVLTADDVEGRMLEQGQLDQAIKHRLEAVQKARSRKDHLAVSQHLRFLLQLQAAAGDWEAVIESGQAFEPAAARTRGAAVSDGVDALFMAEACRRLGRYEDALKQAAQAERKRHEFLKTLTQATPSIASEQRLVLELGALKAYCHCMLGQKEQATQIYQEHKQAVFKVPKNSDPILYLANFEPADLMFMDADMLEHKASLAADFTFTLGRQALHGLRQAKALSAQGPMTKELKDNLDRMEMNFASLVPRWEKAVRAMAPWYLGHAKYIRNDFSAAKQAFEQWLADPGSRSDWNKLWLTCDRLGACCESANDPGSSLKQYQEAVAGLEKQRSFLSRDEYKLRFMLGRDRPYDRLVMLLVKGQEAPRAFEVAERAKARALLDLLESRSAGRTPDSRGLFVELARLGRSIQAGQNRVIMDTTGQPRRIDFDTIRTNNEARLSKTMVQFEQTDPELSSMISSRVLTSSAVAGLLPRDAILLEYYLTKEGGCVFRLEGESCVARALPHAEAAILDLVVKLRTRILGLEGDVESVARQLHDALFRDVVGDSRGKKLYVVPHGPLHYVPFAALHDGKEYLVQRHATTVLPSASVLKYCVGKRRPSWDPMLALGNPKLPQKGFDLRAAEQEIKAIAPLFRKPTVLVGAQATESAFLQQAGKHTVLHLACHGRYDPDRPNQSGLFLAPDGHNDGYLRTAEFFSMSLNASLVTLSACETAMGQVSAGDDLVGLSRAIIYAGSPTVLSTLWAVDDVATSDFMKQFYKELKGGRGKAESLRAAQLVLMNRKGQATVRRGTILAKPGDRGRSVNYSHPFFWAPFVLIGDGE